MGLIEKITGIAESVIPATDASHLRTTRRPVVKGDVETAKAVLSVVNEMCPDAGIMRNANQRLDALGFDSARRPELIAEIEKRCNVKFPGRVWRELKTVTELITWVNAYRNGMPHCDIPETLAQGKGFLSIQNLSRVCVLDMQPCKNVPPMNREGMLKEEVCQKCKCAKYAEFVSKCR